jgi:glycosyltransferase involved in cell wall biosynthesis
MGCDGASFLQHCEGSGVLIRRVLGLGTYPIAKPVHGGQRRVAAFKTFYESIGIEYIYACIYDPNQYGPDLLGPDDLPLTATSPAEGPVALIGDVLSGRQAATDEASFQHFADLVQRLRPDALQLEHPFMWPLVNRLRGTLQAQRLPLIYSSHNVEALLKGEILSVSGVAAALRGNICDQIEQMEAEVSRAAALIVCVSSDERRHYLGYQPAAERIVVVPNGVDRPPASNMEYAPYLREFADRPFAFMVGSAYPPNIDGFCRYVLADGAFMVPPRKSIAVCGGVGPGILEHPVYQRFVTANSQRIQFFPKIEDPELWSIKTKCHAVLLPIGTGRGSNLKTAEALVLGKWIIATPVAMRGYHAFLETEGLIIANDSVGFRRATAQALCSPLPSVSEKSRRAREALYWDRCFADGGLVRDVTSLVPINGSRGPGKALS